MYQVKLLFFLYIGSYYKKKKKLFQAGVICHIEAKLVKFVVHVQRGI